MGVGDLVSSQATIDAVLAKSAKRWRVLGRRYGVASGGSLEYAIRFRKDVDLQDLARRLRQGTGGTIHTLDWRASGGTSGTDSAHRERADGGRESR